MDINDSPLEEPIVAVVKQPQPSGSHPCIKCGTRYVSKDPEPYYCPTCATEKNRIAAEIDRKLGPTTEANHPRSSPLMEYEAQAKTVTSPDGRITRSFAQAKL